MNIDFIKPFWLLLLPAVLGAIYYIGRKGSFPSPFRRRLTMGIRMMVATLLVLAMAMPQVTKTSDITATMFALDRSASVKGGQVSAFLEEANQARGKKDSLGLICFGNQAGVEQMPTLEGALPTSTFATYIDEGGTAIGSALKLAGSVLPEDAAKRVVLLSDGEETTKDALAEARALAARGITLDVYPILREVTEEIQLTAMELPKAVNKGMEYEIALRLNANADTDTEVRLYKGNTLIGQEHISVTAGESRVVFTDKTEKGGNVIYRAEITPERDTEGKNNKAYAYTFIEDVPRVLLVEGTPSQWGEMLSASSLQVERVAPGGVPTTVEGLQGYEGVILADVSAEDLSEGFLTVLESYVRTLGGGLLVSGGENAYALGGYFATPLEEMLPVDMELKTEGESGNLAMVMVIDRSGSMSAGAYGVSQMELAKEAAIRSLDSFQEKDLVGVIAFDSLFQWAVPMTEVGGNQAAITDAIGKIQEGGGTSILPGLTEAVRALTQTDAKEKHIILLTDGQAEQNGYEDVLAQMNQNGITLSSVAVGGGADTKLLQRLAQQGLGRYYFTNEFTDLPEIFAKETLLAGKEYLNNREFYPQQQDASAILTEIGAVPMLAGYVGTTAKARADKVLISDKEEPILATWQYGLGRTAAWTSDMGGKWTKDWLSLTEGVAILRNTLSWVMNTRIAEEMRLSAESGEKESRLRLEMPYDETVKAIGVTAVDSQGKEFVASLAMTAPGIFEGKLPSAEEGAYGAALTVEKTDGTKESYQTGFVLSYPTEYDMTRWGDGEGLLQQLAAIGGGRILEKGSDVFAAEATMAVMPKDRTNLFLWLALGLFIVDIALRRFTSLAAALEGKWNIRKEKGKERSKKTKGLQEKMPQEKATAMAKENRQPREEKQTQSQEKVKTTAEKLAEARKKRGS